MVSVGLVSFSCIMFIHLGLGETINKIFNIDFILFRCPKCLNFWAVLAYTLFFTNFSVVESIASAFLMSYNALWVDLLLSKIAKYYDNWYNEEEEQTESDSNDKG